MSNVRISQLPAAPSAITGTELVPVVQNGQTVQTTVAAITNSPSQTQTFLTLNQESTLPNSRYLSTDANLSLTDGGAQSFYRIGLDGAAASLNTASTGMVIKDSATTVTNRTLTASGAGLSITDGDGIAGNPTFALSGIAAGIANLSGTGIVAVVGSSSAGLRTIQGTANQIALTNGNGVSDPTIGLASDPVLPGTGAVALPSGTVVQRPVGYGGQIRYNTDSSSYEGYAGGTWKTFTLAGGVSSFSAGTTGFTPSIATSGDVVLAGILNVDSGGTGATTLTGYVKGNGTSAMTASATVPTTDLSGTVSNAQLANSAITINGSSVSLGGSITVTATASNALTIGTGLTGTSYNGSAPVTIAIDSTVATLSDIQTLTNKSISGSTNTLTNIPNSALSNSSLTIGSTNVALGGTTTTLAGLASVTLTQDPVSDLQAATKQYVDSVASGLNYHQPVNYASTTTLPAYTYNNGTGGVGATITANANGALSFGGGSPTAGQRLLVKDEAGTNQPYNGIYTVTSAGSAGSPFQLTRATDYDSSGTGTNEIDAGDYVLVLSGTNASTAWVQQTPLPITVGTTALVFLQFNAPITYSAGTGLNLSPATTFNISNTGVTAATYGSASQSLTLAINAQGQITTASAQSIAINGNQITSGTVGSAYISGSYTGITGVGTLTAGTWNASPIANSYLANSSITINGNSVSLGGSTTVTSNTTNVLTFDNGGSGAASGTTFNGSTAVTVSYNTLGASPLAGSTSLVTTGTITTGTWSASAIGVGYGGTGLTSYTTGDLLYASNSSTLSKLAIGASTYVLTSSGTAPQYVAQSTLSVGSATTATTATTATNATNTAITLNSTNSDYYITVVSANTGNLPQLVATGLTANPSTGKITGGISGGTF